VCRGARRGGIGSASQRPDSDHGFESSTADICLLRFRCEHDPDEKFALTAHALTLTDVTSRPVRVCYVPTGVGDSPIAVEAKARQFRERRPGVQFSTLTLFPQPSHDPRRHLLEQDIVLVEGGSVVNLMAVWRAHGLPSVLADCWMNGVVLAGASAGSLCWHVGGPTDSFGDDLAAFTEGLGLLPFSNNVHDNLADQPRRRVFRDLITMGQLPSGYATEDGVGLHYIDTELHEAVATSSTAKAWFVEVGDGPSLCETEILPSVITRQ